MVLEREWRFLGFPSDEHILLDEGGLECSEEIVGRTSGLANTIVFWFLEIVSGEAAGFSTLGDRDKGVAGAVGLHAKGVRMDRGERVNGEPLEGEEARGGENSWPC